jgi:hypothetical protein
MPLDAAQSLRAALALVLAATGLVVTRTANGASVSAGFPMGTFETKITTTDLFNAGWRDYNDAHWETLTFNKDGTWRDVVFHPRFKDQPPFSGKYVVTGHELRLLGTPDVLHWSYADGKLTLRVVHVPDRLGRIVYTAHPWTKTR